MSVELNFEQALERVKSGEDMSTIAKVLLEQLSERERLSLLDGDVPFYPGVKTFLSVGYNRTPIHMGEISRLKIPGLRFTDGPRGIVMGQSTCFPVAMARGATWNIELEKRIGHAIGLEGRAQGANFFGGVCINLPRHPAWGRAQETYSDDPVLLGEFGAALSAGVGKNLMPCVKHFALNSMENARFKVDVQIDEKALHEVYLPHFKRTIDGGALSVMSAYNSVNGQFCGENEMLLTKVLRDLWGFSGVVITDFVWGLRNPILSLRNGCDVEAPFAQQRVAVLSEALKSGDIAQPEVDRAGLRILSAQLQHYNRIDPEEPSLGVVLCKEHRDLAREAAAQAIVLLKNQTPNHGEANDTKILPLDPNTLSSVAVIGRLADKPNTGDHGSSDVHCPDIVTPHGGIKPFLDKSGVQTRLETSDDIDLAVAAAKNSDVALVIVGCTAEDEGEYIVDTKDTPSPPIPTLWEFFKDVIPLVARVVLRKMSFLTAGSSKGGDRTSLRLRQREIEIIQAVSKANPRTIVLCINAGAVIVEPWIAKVPAALYTWYSGCEGGHALADVLFGQVDASGRLPYAVPRSEADLPDFDAFASKAVYDRWHGQRLIDRNGSQASFPLGHGLSYTSFVLSDASVSTSPTPRENFQVQVTIKNTGTRLGRHVVQIYGTIDPGKEDFPRRNLLGFTSVKVEARQSRMVSIQCVTQPLKQWQPERKHFEWITRNVVVEVSSFSGDPDALRLNYTF